MADAADAGNEDHADGRQAGHVLRIVTGAAWHLFGTQSQFLCRLIDQSTNARISRRGNDYVDLFEVELNLVRSCDLIGFSSDLPIKQIDFRRVEVAQLQT